MRKVAHLIVALALVSVVACKEDEPEPMGGGGSGGSGGESGMSGGSSGQGGDSGTTGGGSGQGGGSGMDGNDGGVAGGGSGGSGGTDSDAGSVAVPLDDLPDEFAGAICDALDECLGPTKLREMFGREDCGVRLAAELRAGDLAYVDMSISAGRVIYDADQLPACLDAVRAMGCAVATDTYPDPCGEVLAGNVPAGGDCLVSSECAGTAFCAGRDSCPSTCEALLEEGDECLADDECGDDLLCLGNLCSTLAQEGDACAGDSGRVCALGLSCVGSTDTDAGECETNATVQAGAEDEACEPGGILCEEGLSCVFNGVDGFHCEGPSESGGSCHLGLPGQCPADEYCNVEDDVTIESTCEPLPGAGQACALGYLCSAGTVCLPEGDAANCFTLEGNGGECIHNAGCRSGNCVDGTCEAPLICE